MPSGDSARFNRDAPENCSSGPSVNMNRTTGGGGAGRGLRNHAAVAVRAAVTITAASSDHTAVRARVRSMASLAPGCGAAIPGCSVSTNCATAMSAIRLRRSLSRQRRSSVRTAGATVAGNALQSGSRANTEASVSLTSSPANARLPVSIS